MVALADESASSTVEVDEDGDFVVQRKQINPLAEQYDFQVCIGKYLQISLYLMLLTYSKCS